MFVGTAAVGDADPHLKSDEKEEDAGCSSLMHVERPSVCMSLKNIRPGNHQLRMHTGKIMGQIHT